MSIATSGSLRGRGRNIWFQIHKWLGLILLAVLIPLSLSGSLLVWHDWTDSWINPQRYAVDGGVARPASDYVAAARGVLGPDDRISAIEFPEGEGKAVVIMASPAPVPGQADRPGPPPRRQLWLNPADAKVLDNADANSGAIRFLHVFHGSLLVPGWGRTIVGWLGVAMLISSLTGLWLWLPTVGSIARGLRWDRGPLTSARLHHQFGFWSALPLAILSFTGAYISFPTATRALEGLFTESAAPRPGAGRPPPVRPVAETRMSPDQAVVAAQSGREGVELATLRWPTERAPEWSVVLHHNGARQDLVIDDTSGVVSEGRAPPVTIGRFMRTLHDGNGYNRVWQTIVFLGGIVPALLGITGLIMWLRTRVWRKRVAAKMRSRHAT